MTFGRICLRRGRRGGPPLRGAGGGGGAPPPPPHPATFPHIPVLIGPLPRLARLRPPRVCVFVRACVRACVRFFFAAITARPPHLGLSSGYGTCQPEHPDGPCPSLASSEGGGLGVLRWMRDGGRYGGWANRNQGQVVVGVLSSARRWQGAHFA